MFSVERLTAMHRLSVNVDDDEDDEMVMPGALPTPLSCRRPSDGSASPRVSVRATLSVVAPGVSPFSGVVLSSEALDRRQWLMLYRDPDVEAEFVIFSNRSPWAFPFVVFLCILNALILYVGGLRHWGMLAASASFSVLVPPAALFTSAARRWLPKSLVASAKTRAMFIEHAVMPVFAVGIVFIVLASVQRPGHTSFHVAATFRDALDVFRKDTDPVSGKSSFADVMLDMQMMFFVTIATTPRVTTALPYLVFACGMGCLVVYKASESFSPVEKDLYACELVLKGAVTALLLAGWEWDRRRHFEVCVRTFQRSRQIMALVQRLHGDVSAALPLGCVLPANGMDARYASSDAVVLALQIHLPVLDILQSHDATESECLRRLTTLRCLVAACDKQGAKLGASRFAAMGDEVLAAVGLFDTPAAAALRSPGVRACLFATYVVRAFRVAYRRQHPDDSQDPPSLRIGIDSGAVEAMIPYGSCQSLSAIVCGRAVRGAETLAGLAMPGTALVSSDVRASVREHFLTTELHRLRVAGRQTAVSLLGHQFSTGPRPLSTSGDHQDDSVTDMERTPDSSISIPAHTRRDELHSLLAADPRSKGQLVGNMLCSERFADADVEQDYLMHETNSSMTRYLAPAMAILACASLCVAYYMEGSRMNGPEWACVSTAGLISLVALYIVHRGRMTQRRQIAVRWSIGVIVAAFVTVSAYFHDVFYDYVRFRMNVFITPIGVGLHGIVPSRLPVVVDVTVRMAMFRFTSAVFVGRSIDVHFLPLYIVEATTMVMSYQLVRSRNRWAYVDYAIAAHAKASYARARQIIQEMLAQLMPAHVAEQIVRSSTAEAPPALLTSDAVILCLIVRSRDEDTPRVFVARASPTQPCAVSFPQPGATLEDTQHAADQARADAATWHLLRGMPTVASGAVHLQRHGSRWLLFVGLRDEPSSGVLETLRDELADVERNLITSGSVLSWAIVQSEGRLAGGIVGADAAKGFAAVGPAVDGALVSRW
jgi:class 3 adenylate cyclase